MKAHKLFGSYLEDDGEYQACERYWEAIVSDIEKTLGQEGQWPRWLPRCYLNGTPMAREDNPICDGRSGVLARAFRVLQYPFDGDGVEIDAWVIAYGIEYPEDEFPRAELFISIGLSEESSAIARALLQKWMLPETTVAEMSKYAESVCVIERDDDVGVQGDDS